MSQSHEIGTVPDIVRFWAARAPDSIALIGDATSIGYGLLDKHSNQIANRMVAGGIKPGDHIGYLGMNSVGFFEAWFAAGRIGCAFAPFNWRLSPAELTEIIEDAKPSIVFVDSSLREKMQAVRERTSVKYEIVPFDRALNEGSLQEWAKHAPDHHPESFCDASSPCLLAYTSGTTGVPKGVILSHEAIRHSFRSAAQEPAMAWTSEDTILLGMPNFHLGGSCIAMQALYNGGRISVIPSFDPALTLQRIARDRATILPLVPAALQMILDHPAIGSTDLSSLRCITYFGSAIGAETVRRAREQIGCNLVQHYGTTETWIITVLRPADHDVTRPARLSSCGVAVPLVQIRVVDPAGADVASETVGQVLVKSPTTFSGYLGKPDATNAVMRDGWYSTGDLGFLDPDGYLTLVDRAKDMIVSGGENVYSVEVERALLRHPAVATAAVIGTPDSKWGEKVTAFVVCNTGAAVAADELKHHCRELLAGYKVPKEILLEEALPMTPNGKIQKAVLRERFWGDQGRAIG
ncbi:MAG: long-chain-fatty-acid--CoA ligase [Rhizobiales bacterium]|nr:long-chain-fatty-acid--CoA ligase [Hyphomicrobiales bacterium]